MIFISFLQALFFSTVIYGVACLAHNKWFDWTFYVMVLGLSFMASIIYEFVLDKVVTWFNKDHGVFRG